MYLICSHELLLLIQPTFGNLHSSSTLFQSKTHYARHRTSDIKSDDVLLKTCHVRRPDFDLKIHCEVYHEK